ncbi:methyl-accepting chemotaxis protein [Natronorubrum texcoconense]|uniref:Methyl-accepting chemotaxis protein n=1 Tax=Natronorubrum texcoconense TaxID=1095776 RepID=A0A1G8SVR1_9EURY|nr:methyl-accepting chemotaxis protein [Natronorubrum texcoconense]SDJ33339.1 methyl-accepting chemotaxis protein [Natronorubrum texcoconense]
MDVFRRLVPSAIRRRYAVKFGIVLLILGLGVGLVGFGATAGITNQVEDRVQDDHTSFASQEAQNLQMWNEQNEHTIGVIAWSDVVASDEPDAIEERFLDWEEHLDADTHAISYVDTDDETVLASTNLDTGGEEPTTVDEIDGVPAEAYEEAAESEGVPWVSDAYTVDRELGDEQVTVMTYVLSVPNADDRAIVYTAELEAHANRLADDDGITTMVVDGDNNVMADNEGYGEDHETLGLAYGDQNADTIVEPARTEGAGTNQVPGSALSFDTAAYDFSDDEDYVVSSARVLGTDWVVVTHEPESQAYGFVNTVNDWGIYATLAGVLMIGLIGAVLGRNTAVSIDRLTGKASKMEEGDLDVDLETKRVDNIGRLYNGFDSMRDALREQIEEAEAAREDAERERKRVEEINGHLEEKADEYSDVMEAAADGNLTARMDAESDNEAMAEIADEFNQMLEEIEQTVAELNRFATDVATASEQVTASSEEVRSASQQVTESIQEISDGAERQNESLQSVNQEMSGLSTTTEEIAASSNEVADIAERTVDTGQEGQQAAQEAIAAMNEIETEAGGAVDEIRRLEEEVQQIDELIATISEIARQTNMLALNANIEASRSAGGQDDEGFSVVAKEVKALSEDVAEAADEAEDRLEAIRERTEQSADEVAGTSENIEDAGEQVEEAVKALEEIADLAQETNIGVQEISAATEEQAASTQEVVAMVDDAATVSEETTSEAENVAAAAEEQTTALTEVTKSASNLSGQAAELSEALDRFDTDADRAALELDFDEDDDPDLPGLETGDEASEEQTPEANDQRQGQGITLESSQPETSEPAETRDSETPQSTGFQAEETGTTSQSGFSEGRSTDPAPETDAEPAAAPEPDAEPAPAPDTEQDAHVPNIGESSGDATELGAEEILGIDDERDADVVAGEPAAEPETESADDADPLAGDAGEPNGDATDPLGEGATEPVEENAAEPLKPVEDTETDDEPETDAEPVPADTENADTQDDADDTVENDDDVFTFGNTDDE